MNINTLNIITVTKRADCKTGLSLSVNPLAVRPSRFMGVVFIVFVTSVLCRHRSFRRIVIADVFSTIFILVLMTSGSLNKTLLCFFACLIVICITAHEFICFKNKVLTVVITDLLKCQLFSRMRTHIRT